MNGTLIITGASFGDPCEMKGTLLTAGEVVGNVAELLADGICVAAACS